MPRQTPSASDFTSVVRSSAVGNDIASKPVGSPGAAKSARAAVSRGGGLGLLGTIGSIVRQSAVGKSITPPPVKATVVVVPVLPLSLSGTHDAFVICYDTDGKSQWSAKISSTTADYGFGITTDSVGNVYVVGQGGNFTPTTAFNSDGTAFTPIMANSGSNDTFIVKYNTTGFVVWTARVASGDLERALSITTDSTGNVYVSGQGGNGTVIAFDANEGPSFATKMVSIGSNDAFIIKYSSAGLVQWAARVGGFATEQGFGITTDSDSNVYVTGQAGGGFMSGGVSTDFAAYNSDTTKFATTITNPGSNEAFLVKYNSNGVVQWLTRVASSGSDIAYGVAADSSGNVYITGQGGSGAVLTAFNSNGPSFASTIANSGINDAFLVKYNTSGIVQWVTRLASSGEDAAYGISLDSSGNVYVTGMYSTTFTAYNSDTSQFTTTLTSLGSTDAFLVKYNPSGFVQWLTRVASTGEDIAYGIVADSSGNVYITGQGGSGAVLTAFNSNGPSFATKIANSGSNDAFIAKYNSDGIVQWVTRVGGTGADIGRGIAVDITNRRLYVTGIYSSNPLAIYDA
jgi:hypothetical protein